MKNPVTHMKILRKWEQADWSKKPAVSTVFQRRLKAMFAGLSLKHRQHGANLHLACRVVGISNSVYRYQPD